MNYIRTHILSKHSMVILLACFMLVACKTAKEEVASGPWTRIGPGGGGSTFIPTFSYGSGDKFVVRCDMTGSYITQDGGLSYHQANFPNGASAYAFDPADDNRIYLGSEGLFVSPDGGANWEMIFPRPEWIQSSSFLGDHASYSIDVVDTVPFPGGSIRNITIDPQDSQTVCFSIDAVLYYSRDNGTSWRHAMVDAPIEFIWLDPGTNSILFFTTAAMYRLDMPTNSLEERPLPNGMSPAYSFSGGISKRSGQTIFYALHRDTLRSLDIAKPTDIYVSYDAGMNWSKVNSPAILNEGSRKPSYSRIACASLDASRAYVVTDQYIEKNGDGGELHWYGTLHSSDAGKSWSWVWKGGGGSGQYGVKDGQGVSNLTDAWVEEAFGGEYIRLIDVGVYPHDGNIAIVTDWYRTMKTIDGGKTWREIYSERQPDGTFISRGMDVTTSYGVHRDPFDSDHLAISYTDIGYHHSYNSGKSWTRSTDGVPVTWQNTCYWVVFDPDVKDRVWSGWSGMHDFPRGKMTRSPQWKARARGGVCVSDTGGRRWQPSSEGLPEAPVTTIVIDPNSEPGRRTLYAGLYGSGVYKSTDDGKTWEAKNSGIEENLCAFELTITPKGALYLIVSPTPIHKDGKRGSGYLPGAVYKSTDGANTWQPLTVTEGSLFPNGLAYDPQKPERLYLACWSDIMLSDLVGGDVARTSGGNHKIEMAGGVFVSENGGGTWTQLFDRNQYVYDVTVHPTQPSRLYINTFNKAAYGSEDYGKTWKKIDGYDFHWGHRVMVDEHVPDKVFITTFGSSVWYGEPRFAD